MSVGNLADRAASPLRWLGVLFVIGMLGGDPPDKPKHQAPAQRAHHAPGPQSR